MFPAARSMAPARRPSDGGGIEGAEGAVFIVNNCGAARKKFVDFVLSHQKIELFFITFRAAQ